MDSFAPTARSGGAIIPILYSSPFDAISTKHHDAIMAVSSVKIIKEVRSAKCTVSSALALSPEDRRQILFDWNDTEVARDTYRCIHWLFEDRAAAAPDSIALDDGQSVVTYGELNRRANQFAQHLSSIGIGRGSLVGICVQRSMDLITTVLAILKAGAAYVPMEPAWPDQRIDFIATSLRLDGLVTDPANLHRFARLRTGGLKITSVPDERVTTAQLSGRNSDNPPRTASPDDRAYIIFTSGSTGDPKGVVVRHRSVINLIGWVNERFKVNSADKIFFTTSIAFDLSVYDIFGILAAGGAIRIATTDELKDPPRLSEILCSSGISFWDSAPAALERLVPFLSIAHQAKLRLVFLSGDWIPLSLPPAIKHAFPGSTVVSLGGATEATIWSNYHEIDEIDPSWKSIPYGRPIQNARYYILDRDQNPCPIGAAGELYIGGLCVAEGYANDPVLTARKFISSPFVHGDRLYRTGDRARFWRDGKVELLGRLDRQVKIRGFRVEPGEIEAKLEEHPKVRRAAVVVEGDAQKAKRLLAYVVLDPTARDAANARELRRHLCEALPDWMLPAQFVIVPEMPLTGNGKVDRFALESMRPRSPRVSKGRIAARTKIQQQLADQWCRILGLGQVGIHESFFDLGGDSLRSVEMITAAAAVGLELRFDDLKTHFTISDLSALARRERIRTSQVADGAQIPLTPTQQWFFNRPFRHPGRYNMVFGFELAHPIRPETLREALRHLQMHHDALRLRFRREGDKWVQVLARQDLQSDVANWDLSLLSAAAQSETIARRLIDLRCRFDLQRDPLIKAVLIETGARRPQQMLLVLHHLIFDAVSLSILREDLSSAINQLDRGHKVELPPGGSFAQWAHTLEMYAASSEANAEVRYWLELPWRRMRELPRDVSAGANRYGTSRTVRSELSSDETSCVGNQVPRQCNASIGEILLSLCVHTLSRWARCDDVFVDLTNHGRQELPDAISFSRTVGYITSITPILISVPPDATPRQTIKTVQDHLRRMPSHGMGYGILRHLSPVDQSISQLRQCPRPELKFNYSGSMATDAVETTLLRPIATTFDGVLDPDDERAYLHNLDLWIVDRKLVVEWKYNSAVHRAQTISELLDNYVSALRELIKEASSGGPG
jgi:amino acid adenylation domain-containing protein/non-ribosomal peptide synthase protein (TIGR01720 family)